jgi:NAD(P)-dependent dehydrogenase (short-subunit alcohol dehydrogenase family)
MAALVRNRFSTVLQSNASFEGKTILITGATGGLGLEAAKKLAAQGTSKLIITSRNENKGAIAKAAIEEYLGSLPSKPTNGPTIIIPLALEMSDPSSFHTFVAALKTHTNHLDQAILNAGLSPESHILSSSGYETTIQVNAISTSILGLLLLPFLLASPLTSEASVSHRPHLTFISSGTAWIFSLESLHPYSSSEKPIQALSQREAFPQGGLGGGRQYARSKLLLEYAIRPLAFLPSLLSDPNDPNSDPKVLVSSTCPGLCRSDLGRAVTGKSWLLGLLSKVFLFIFARSAENGANTYITSLELGIEARGETWKEDRIWDKEPRVERNIRSAEGKQLGDKVWKEFKDIALKEDRDGAIEELLGEGKKTI